MNFKPYRPSTGSLASQVVGFFTNNRDEHLLLDDICDKFDCVRGNIHTLLKPAVDAGLLKRELNADTDWIYQRGPNAAGAPESTSTGEVPVQGTSAALQCAPKKGSFKVIDIAALKVDDNVPFVPKASSGASKWDALFDKLKKVNQSVPIPDAAKSALTAAACKRNKLKKGTYRVGLSEEGETRVWRVA